MYLWRRLADPKWVDDRGGALRSLAGERLVTVERPGRRSVVLEVVCRLQAEARKIARSFGGRVEKLPRDWLKVYAQAQVLPPLRIGKRLIVVDGENGTRIGPAHLVIPAGAAFGTGGHATTAMTLRLLEEITRLKKTGWSLADLGTGSGILALAASCLGAGRVLAIDNDPAAIATARANARSNEINRVVFQVADVRRWRPKGRVEFVTANLFSELLIETLPGIHRFLASGGMLIVSGILRSQERDVNKALRRNEFQIVKTRRRGKWVAILSCS
jgi:ribosomal protein L11 methyltransferase